MSNDVLDINVPRISVIIVNYNSGDLLGRCLSSLLSQLIRDWEAIIVDNASSDGALDAAIPPDPRVRLIALGSNIGFAAANNKALTVARASWIATLNPDAFPEPDWLERLLDATRRYPDFRFFGSTQLAAETPEILDGAGDCYHALGIPWRGGYAQPVSILPPEGEVFGPCAAAALYSRDLLLSAGGFDESFFCYCEDVDLAFRMRVMGERCIQVRDAVVKHQGSAITGVRSAFSLYHSSRNRLWTFVKNMPGPLLVLLLPFHLVATFYLLFRFRNDESFEPQWKGLMEGFQRIGPVLQARRKVQASRRISSFQCASFLVWSLDSLRRRPPHVWAPKPARQQ